jgi:hypothetical protein
MSWPLWPRQRGLSPILVLTVGCTRSPESQTIHRCTNRRTPYRNSPLTCDCPYDKIAPAQWRRVAWHPTKQPPHTRPGTHSATMLRLAPHPARHFLVTPPTPPIRNPGLPAPPHPAPCRPPQYPVPPPFVPLPIQAPCQRRLVAAATGSQAGTRVSVTTW